MTRSAVSRLAGLNIQVLWRVDELRRLNPGVLVVYEFDAPGIPELRAAVPDVRICLRMFGDFRDTRSLVNRAYQLASAYLRDGDAVTPANEPNLEYPEMSIEDIGLYSQRFVTGWRALAPLPVKLVSPALSPSARLGNALPSLQMAWQRYDLIGVHCYWPRAGSVSLTGPASHVVTYRETWPDKPCWVTEWGRAFNHQDGGDAADAGAEADSFLNQCAALGYVVGAAGFLWDCLPEKEWRDWVIQGTPVETALYHIGQSTEPDPPPAPDNGGVSMPPESGPCLTVNGFDICWAFRDAYQAMPVIFGVPQGPAAYSEQAAIQRFSKGVMVWTRWEFRWLPD